MGVTVCPDGHQSDSADWCDTCGLPMADPAPGVVTPAAPKAERAPKAPGAVGNCPNCTTPRMPDEAFCEVCGLDFATGKLPQAPGGPTPAQPAASAPLGWSLAIAPDRDWWIRQEAEAGRAVAFPDTPGFTHTIQSGETVIGRRSEGAGWYPTVDLGHRYDDPAVSRKHAAIRVEGDGLVVVDIGSTNGTRHNDAVLVADQPVALEDGDVLHLGAFTRITVTRTPVTETAGTP